MKKTYMAALAASAAAGIWCASRDRKYPVREELRFANKFFAPGWVISPGTAKLSNRLLNRMPLPEPPRGVERRSAQLFAEDGMPIRLTLYRPAALDGKTPCLVYFHGGGFCVRDAGYIHRYAARYAKEARCEVAFVHYRTADEAPFPVPFQDCYAALRWVWAHSGELGINRERIAVGGDSAGGALAAACALRARDEGEIQLCFQLLVYPVTDSRMETGSMKKFTDSPMWNANLNRRMWALYLRDGDHGMAQYAAPMLAGSFAGLPPAYVETEEFDCLHDEGIAYAQALSAAGVPVELENIKGTFHGFDSFWKADISRAAVEKRIEALRWGF